MISISFDIDGTIVPSIINYSKAGCVLSPLFPVLCMFYKHIQGKPNEEFINFINLNRGIVKLFLVSSRPRSLSINLLPKANEFYAKRGISWYQARDEKIKNILTIKPEFHIDNSMYVVNKLLTTKVKPLLYKQDIFIQLQEIINAPFNY